LASAASPAAWSRAPSCLEVTALELSEFHKGDGALTCLSLRLPVAGSWCV